MKYNLKVCIYIYLALCTLQTASIILRYDLKRRVSTQFLLLNSMFKQINKLF